MTNRSVYLLLTDTGTLFTKAIKLYTRKTYNHASIALDENLTQVYSFGRKKPHNPFIGGFVQENIAEGLFQNASCAIFEMTITEKEYNIMQQFIEEIATTQDSYRYNLMGLIAVALKVKLERGNAFFCSEFVATVLSRSDRIQFEKSCSFITPYDLQILEEMQLVYQGKLKHYNHLFAKEAVSPLSGVVSV